jgi:hypothetical protein
MANEAILGSVIGLSIGGYLVGKAGKLPAGLQATFNQLFGASGSGPGSPLPPGPIPGPNGPPIVSSAGAVITCGDGVPKPHLWAEIDAGLQASNSGGKYGQHDQNEANLYQSACGGFKVPGTTGT